MANMLKQNLEIALYLAIRSQQDFETKENGQDFESVFVAGLKEILKALQRGETINVQ